MKISKPSELNSFVRETVTQHASKEFPVVFTFGLGMEHPEFRITIEKTAVDTFTDASGQKWKKVK